MRKLYTIILTFIICLSCFTPVRATTADYYDNGFFKIGDNYVNRLGEPIVKAVARGIDVSQYQGVIDWKQVAEDDISFAFIRCGSSVTGPDTMFDINCQQALENNIPIGIYYFTQGVTDDFTQTEIDYTLSCAKKYKISLPVVIDVEGALMASIGYTQLQSTIDLFCEQVKAAGYTPMVYASTSFMTNHIRDCKYTKWIAQYGDYLEYTGDNVNYWQCTSHGFVKGIEGRVDINLQLEDDFGEVVYSTKPVKSGESSKPVNYSNKPTYTSGNMYTNGLNVFNIRGK